MRIPVEAEVAGPEDREQRVVETADRAWRVFRSARLPFTSGGAVDPTFGVNGIRHWNHGAGFDYAEATAFQHGVWLHRLYRDRLSKAFLFDPDVLAGGKPKAGEASTISRGGRSFVTPNSRTSLNVLGFSSEYMG